MVKQLAELQREIMLMDNTVEDWERLTHEVNEAMTNATDDEIQKFVDSGAGEELDMMCSALAEIRKRR